MTRLIFINLLLLVNSLNLFGQENLINEDVKSFHDVSYKGIYDKDSLKLDIFLPEKLRDSLTPLVAIVHGGAWIAGDKELEPIYYMRELKKKLMVQGIAVASIEYRLVDSTTHFPSPVQDCKDAIRWLHAHAGQYGLDTSKFAVWGGSAGAHLALLMANSDNQDFLGDSSLAQYSCDLKFVIDNFGPTNLNTLFKMNIGNLGTWFFKSFINKLYLAQRKITFAMTGYSFREKQKIKDKNWDFSPIRIIDNNSVPTLIMHGNKDRVVPLKQSKMLQASLNEHGIKNQLIIVKNGDHGFNNIPKEKLDELINITVDFACEQFVWPTLSDR